MIFKDFVKLIDVCEIIVVLDGERDADNLCVYHTYKSVFNSIQEPEASTFDNDTVINLELEMIDHEYVAAVITVKRKQKEMI